jgi:hypothetical protein
MVHEVFYLRLVRDSVVPSSLAERSRGADRAGDMVLWIGKEAWGRYMAQELFVILDMFMGNDTLSLDALEVTLLGIVVARVAPGRRCASG